MTAENTQTSLWELVGELPEIALSPKLTLHGRNVIISARHQQKEIDHHFKLDLKTKQCIKIAKGYNHDDNQKYVTLTDYPNIGFDDNYNLYLQKKDNKWYQTRSPQRNSSFIVSKNGQYIITFGGVSRGKRDIFVRDVTTAKWYQSAVKLPHRVCYLSAIVIENMSESVISNILSYWIRICQFESLLIFPKDILDIIMSFHPNSDVYILGGIRELTEEAYGFKNIYKIGLHHILNHMTELSSFRDEEIVDINDCKFSNILFGGFGEIECFVCYDDGMDVFVEPCLHLLCCLECMEHFLHDATIRCIQCRKLSTKDINELICVYFNCTSEGKL